MKPKRYVMKEAKGGKYNRFYVWDTETSQMVRGALGKFEAHRLEHELNNIPIKGGHQ